MELSRQKVKLVERLRNPRFRPREGLFLVEGVRGAGEFLRPGVPREIRFALVSPRLGTTEGGTLLREGLDQAPFPVLEISDSDFGALSDTPSPQGVLLVVKEPAEALASMEGEKGLRVLLLDGIQDPGNAGNLLRAARAFGATGVVALDGTVDPWSPKVVRASAGSLAHIPVARLPWAEAAPWLEKKGVGLVVAHAGGEDLRGFRPPSSWALAVGNEGSGVREEILEEASDVLAIPMAPGTDSINAGSAGAIFLFMLSFPLEGEGSFLTGEKTED